MALSLSYLLSAKIVAISDRSAVWTVPRKPKYKPTLKPLQPYCMKKLYEETDPEQVKTLAGIEEAVRGHMLEHVSPEIGNFLLQQVAARQADATAASTASLDE